MPHLGEWCFNRQRQGAYGAFSHLFKLNWLPVPLSILSCLPSLGNSHLCFLSGSARSLLVPIISWCTRRVHHLPKIPLDWFLMACGEPLKYFLAETKQRSGARSFFKKKEGKERLRFVVVVVCVNITWGKLLEHWALCVSFYTCSNNSSIKELGVL